MNKEEVIKVLESQRNLFENCYNAERVATALTRAIELLQEPTGMKKRILEKMGEIGPDGRYGWQETWTKLRDFIQSLSDSQPEQKQPDYYPGQTYQKLFEHMSQEHNLTLLQGQMDDIIQIVREMDQEPIPFQHPVPNGMEVVTRDGRKVEQLTEFKGAKYPLVGLVTGTGSTEQWNMNGGWSSIGSEHHFDLFLRPIERKVWVVEYPDANPEPLLFVSKDYPETADHQSATIYEANLKPVK